MSTVYKDPFMHRSFAFFIPIKPHQNIIGAVRVLFLQDAAGYPRWAGFAGYGSFPSAGAYK
jgi:hypothetical protein